MAAGRRDPLRGPSRLPRGTGTRRSQGRSAGGVPGCIPRVPARGRRPRGAPPRRRGRRRGLPRFRAQTSTFLPTSLRRRAFWTRFAIASQFSLCSRSCSSFSFLNRSHSAWHLVFLPFFFFFFFFWLTVRRIERDGLDLRLGLHADRRDLDHLPPPGLAAAVAALRLPGRRPLGSSTNRHVVHPGARLPPGTGPRNARRSPGSPRSRPCSCRGSPGRPARPRMRGASAAASPPPRRRRPAPPSASTPDASPCGGRRCEPASPPRRRGRPRAGCGRCRRRRPPAPPGCRGRRRP